MTESLSDEQLDHISIKGIRLRCIIGVNDWERLVEQEVVIDLALYADLRQAGRTDNITYTANYRTITKNVVEHVKESKYMLIEALAQGVADVCLMEPSVVQAVVSISKPGALTDSDNVGVEIIRGR